MSGANQATGVGGAPQPVLPWMRLPISIPTGSGVPLEQVQGLNPALRQAVGDCLGFTELFPVQAAVWRGLAGGHSTSHDMCICAPTGSGKTLAYALPLLNAICSSAHPHRRQLAGLVVLPMRDLAVQVHKVLSALGTAAGLTVALAAAQESVAAEAAGLVSHPSQPGSGPQLLVATPGRLMAHLQGTAGFSIAGLSGAASSSSSSSSSSSPRLLKLVVSATLTRDPSKLLRLELHYPRYITLADVAHRYAVPKQLSQWRLVVPAQHKPLALLGLLHQLAGSSTIVFASSLETTHRLYLMLAAVPGLPDKVAEYSSQLPPEQRAASLAGFRSGAIGVLVTSDAMARGMDVASIANVVNYDPPVYPKTYVHPLVPSFLTSSSSSSLPAQHQQARGAKAAAKKKAAPAKGKNQKGPQAAKKQKQRMDSKPFDEKDPLNQKVISMLVPPAAAQPPAPRSAEQQQEMVARAKQYSRQKMQEHAQWQEDLCMKLKLKKAALQALPPELRAAALQEDLTPFPLTRHFLYDTPPDSYRD
ncbi:hypothetical protein OEZ86_002976 [Tetradesmus obliquus]|nr:hypothetical protein OEZ86_002976 [Tetradesmus obliquus]